MIQANTNTLRTIAGLSFVLLYLIACEPEHKSSTPKLGTVESKIAMIGDRAVATHYPGYDRKKYPISITQDRNVWIFQYQLPENMIGGTPVVKIDKKTLDVVKVYESQ